MSSASSSSVSITVTECLAALNAAWQVPPATLSTLESIRAQVAAGSSLPDLVAADADTLSAAMSSLSAVHAPDDAHAIDPSAPLAEQVRGALSTYQDVARAMLADAVISALRAPTIGFRNVKVCAGATATAVEARLGHSVVQVFVHPDLRIEDDWAVGPGGACEPLRAAFIEELASRGIHTTMEWTDRHDGKRDGAHLIEPARAADPQEPVRGAVKAKARRHKQVTPAPPQRAQAPRAQVQR